LYKSEVIDKESLLDLLEPPMKQLLKDRLKKMEEKKAEQQKAQAAAQQAEKQAPAKGKPDLKQVG